MDKAVEVHLLAKQQDKHQERIVFTQNWFLRLFLYVKAAGKS